MNTYPRVANDKPTTAQTMAGVRQFIDEQVVYDIFKNQLIDSKTKMPKSPEAVWEAYNLGDKGFVPMHIFSSLVKSSVTRFDPIQEWSNALPKWTEGDVDYIERLLKKVPAVDKPLARLYLTNWLIRVYRQAVFNETNRYVLILFGPQDKGKSSFLKWLSPYEDWRLLSPIEYNKDTQIYMAKFFIWIDEEMSAFKNYKAVGAYKALISIPDITVRPPYKAVEVRMPRRCSLCGSIDEGEFLPMGDPNTRFTVIELSDNHFDWKGYSKIDKLKLWAQIKYLAGQQDKSIWLEKNKRLIWAEQLKSNKTFEKVSTEKELIDSYVFKMEEVQKKKVVMMTTEIIEAIARRHEQINRMNTNIIGSLLTAKFGKKINGYSKDGVRRLGYPVFVDVSLPGQTRLMHFPEKPARGTAARIFGKRRSRP